MWQNTCLQDKLISHYIVYHDEKNLAIKDENFKYNYALTFESGLLLYGYCGVAAITVNKILEIRALNEYN